MGIGFPRAAGESAGKCGVGIEASIREGGARREWEDKAGDRGFLHDRLSWFGHTWLVPTAERVLGIGPLDIGGTDFPFLSDELRRAAHYQDVRANHPRRSLGQTGTSGPFKSLHVVNAGGRALSC